MARTQNKLTALAIKKLKADPQKSIKIGDGGNLYFRIDPNGSRYWIFNYTRPYTGKRNEVSLGTYPEISLEEARKIRDEYKLLIKQGHDPASHRLQVKHQRQHELDNTFAVIAAKWLEKRKVEQKQDSETIRRLEHDALPYIGKLSFDQITLAVLEDRVFNRILERQAYSVAKRLKSDLNQIFKFARKRKLITYNPIEDIELPSPPVKNHPAVTEPKDLSELVKAIWSYADKYPRSIITTQVALKLSLLIFQRPGEIRSLKKEYYYKDERCLKFVSSKTKQEHIVPLSTQAIELLESIIHLYPESEYFFIGRDGKNYISENTMNSALGRLGFAGKHTAHGSRASARTTLDEVLKKRTDYIEHQLAHKVKDPNGLAYNRAKYLEERRHMMQDWSDYLESFLETKSDVNEKNLLNI
jgi:integrase